MTSQEVRSMKRLMVGSVGVLALLVMALPSRADDREPATQQEFLAKAIATDMAEIKLGELALKQASNDDVKRFARKMVDDHSKHRDMLLERARVHKLAVVEGLDKEHQEKKDRLSKLEGKDFDREYMKCMVEGHEKALKMYQ